MVIYHEGDGEEMEENLIDEPWQIWSGTEEEYKWLYPSKKIKKVKMTYMDMVMESMHELYDKNGVTLQAIRKYIEVNLFQNEKQPASFKNLTKKALDSAVASGRVEKLRKLFYRVANSERDRRRDEMIGFEAPRRDIDKVRQIFGPKHLITTYNVTTFHVCPIYLVPVLTSL